jgi:hypothetical protein
MFDRMSLLVIVCLIPIACGKPAPPVTVTAVVSTASLPDSDAPDEQPIEEQTGSKSKRKIVECNALIKIINKAVEDLNGRADDGSDPVDDYKVMADTMARVADDVSKLETTDKQLKKLSDDYHGMARNVSKSARDLIKAADAGNLDRVEAAKTAIENAVKQEDPIVDAINKYCHAR